MYKTQNPPNKWINTPYHDFAVWFINGKTEFEVVPKGISVFGWKAP